MLGYAFMGKAHSRAFARALRSSTRRSPPELVSICGPRPRRRGRGARARYGWARGRSPTGASRSPTTASGSSSTAARTRCTPSRRSRRHGPASTSSARSRSALDAAESHAMWRAARARGRRPPVRLQLPLRARRSAARASCSRRASSASSSTSARATSSRGAGRRRPTSGASTARRRGHGRDRRPRRAHRRPRALPRRRDRSRCRPSCARSSRATRSTTRSRRRSSSRTARSARSRPRGSRAGASTRTPSSSTARAARSRSTSSASTSCRSSDEQRFAASSSRSPSTRMSYWWPPGHILGWGDTFTHELRAPARRAIAGEATVAPHGATFEDGYRARRGLRRDPALGRERTARGERVSRARVKTSLGIWAFGPMATRFVPGGYQPRAGRRDDGGARARARSRGSAT